MSKVKIVQIAMAISENEYQADYLDDKGRVWQQVYAKRPSRGGGVENVLVWQQLNLPEEPKS